MRIMPISNGYRNVNQQAKQKQNPSFGHIASSAIDLMGWKADFYHRAFEPNSSRKFIGDYKVHEYASRFGTLLTEEGHLFGYNVPAWASVEHAQKITKLAIRANKLKKTLIYGEKDKFHILVIDNDTTDPMNLKTKVVESRPASSHTEKNISILEELVGICEQMENDPNYEGKDYNGWINDDPDKIQWNELDKDRTLVPQLIKAYQNTVYWNYRPASEHLW